MCQALFLAEGYSDKQDKDGIFLLFGKQKREMKENKLN